MSTFEAAPYFPYMDHALLLKEQFDIVPRHLTKLEGYDSLNFKVECTGGTFVLKKYPNSKENRALLAAENATLTRLAGLEEFDFPVAIPNLHKDFISEDKDGLYRLLSYIEGNFLGDVSRPPALLHSFGIFLAKMDSALLNFNEAPIAAKITQWDLQHFILNYDYLKYITTPGDRSLVDYFFLQYEEQIRPLQNTLRKSVIHNDANDWNVLTRNGQVSGIIDFGDMCYSWLINEIAVALTYIMMQEEDPLNSARQVITAYHKILPLKREELDILYYLIAARLCTSVCNSACSKTLKPDSDYITISEKPAWDLLRKLLTINPLRAQAIFREAAGYSPANTPELRKQLKRRERSLSSALSLSYEQPIQMIRAAFQYMYDSEGNAFLDAYNNIMIAGHCHPGVVRAGQGTMARLNTNTRYVYDEILSYSEQLLSKFPEQLNTVFFVNSGSEASDLAIRLATAYSKKDKIMVLEHGYHGNTRMGTAISHYKYHHKNGIGHQPTTIATTLPKAFGSGFEDDGSAGSHFASKALQFIKDHQNTIAAFIAEPIVGCGGQVPLAKGYLNEIYPAIRAQGGVCISDEVQVGFGRLGTCFWGFELYGVVPDIVVLGKPMGNGHPIGAVVTTAEIAGRFEKGPEFFSSFGGNPVSCAIASAVLGIIEDENLQHRALTVGKYLTEALKQLQKEFPQIADVRGKGLFLGVELLKASKKPDTALAAHLKNRLREQHILISTDGPYDNVLKIKPPLSFTKQDAELLVAAITSILRNLA